MKTGVFLLAVGQLSLFPAHAEEVGDQGSHGGHLASPRPAALQASQPEVAEIVYRNFDQLTARGLKMVSEAVPMYTRLFVQRNEKALSQYHAEFYRRYTSQIETHARFFFSFQEDQAILQKKAVLGQVGWLATTLKSLTGESHEKEPFHRLMQAFTHLTHFGLAPAAELEMPVGFYDLSFSVMSWLLDELRHRASDMGPIALDQMRWDLEEHIVRFVFPVLKSSTWILQSRLSFLGPEDSRSSLLKIYRDHQHEMTPLTRVLLHFFLWQHSSETNVGRAHSGVPEAAAPDPYQSLSATERAELLSRFETEGDKMVLVYPVGSGRSRYMIESERVAAIFRIVKGHLNPCEAALRKE